MSKRKRPSSGQTPAGTDQNAAADAINKALLDAPGAHATASADDAAAKDDMAHVSPDILAGSPDIFASKPAPPAREPEASTEPAIESPAEASTEDAPPAPAEAAASADPVEVAPQAPPETPSPAPPAAMPPGAYPIAAPPPAPRRRGGSSTALGIVLVVVGLFALGVVVFGIDLTSYGWPLFVIIPGLTLLVLGFVGLGPGASIPGGILTMLGLVLAYQSASGDWPSWAFAWALVAPFGVGLGMYLQALRDRDPMALRRGRNLMFAGAIIFMIGFVFFESILGISGNDYGIFGKAALPALLIVIGIILLVRSVQRSRRA
jgi:hypothetical protein